MLIRARLTRRDIDRGQPYDPERCPVALALAREFPAPLKPLVYLDRIAIDFGDSRGLVEYPSNPKIRRLVRRFDDSELIRPTVLEWSYPDG